MIAAPVYTSSGLLIGELREPETEGKMGRGVLVQKAETEWPIDVRDVRDGAVGVDERELPNATRSGVTAGERAQPVDATPTGDFRDVSVDERKRHVVDNGPADHRRACEADVPVDAGRIRAGVDLL